MIPPGAMTFRAFRVAIVILAALAGLQTEALAAGENTARMAKARYGLFMHYQYRILLSFSIKTNPQFPRPEQMIAEQ